MLKKLVGILLVCLSSFCCKGQNLDSLIGVWEKKEESIAKQFEALHSLLIPLAYNFPDSTLKYAEEALRITKQKKLVRYDGNLYNSIGAAYFIKGNYDKAINYYFKAISTYEKTNNTSSISSALSNIGGVYYRIKDFKKAKASYFQSIKFMKGKDESKEAISNTYHNIGMVYKDNGQHDSSMIFFNKAFKIMQALNDSISMAIINTEIGNLYFIKGVEDSSYKYLSIAHRELKKKIPNSSWAMYNHIALGEHYIYYPMADLALYHSKKALQLSRQMKLTEAITTSSKITAQAYAQQGIFDSAYFYMNEFRKWNDSILNERVSNEILQKQMTFEHEKEKALQEQEYQSELNLRTEKADKQKIIIYASALGLVALLAILLLILNRFKVTSKQKRTIEKQKEIVEDKNREVTDSINYAQRIQSAILPSSQFIESLHKENFVFFQPKDIVSGDFYWFEKSPNNSILIGAIDCTGHGVPGAFMSIVGHNILSKSVSEYGLSNPGKILDFLHHNVQKTLQAENTEVKDGMDLSLISISPLKDNKRTIEYAGAMNPLYYTTAGNLIEIKGDKMAIAGLNKDKPFSNNKIELSKGDCVYLFTDGFADQFGGEKGKKYKYKPFKNLLLSILEKTMEEQHSILVKEFENWKGDLEQIDDVCVIGMRL